MTNARHEGVPVVVDAAGMHVQDLDPEVSWNDMQST
jgi:hypothetical protein